MIARFVVTSLAAALLAFAGNGRAVARDLKSNVIEVPQIPSVRPEFPVPKEPNMLFYIQRSVNSNTVVYAARLDAQGRMDQGDPVDVYWRWYNVDGHRKPLNFIERHMAYGVSVENRAAAASNGIPFKVAALPEMTLFLKRDSRGSPEALVQIGDHLARLVYAYLQVDNRGLMPDVTAIDLFGIDTLSGKALREHLARN